MIRRSSMLGAALALVAGAWYMHQPGEPDKRTIRIIISVPGGSGYEVKARHADGGGYWLPIEQRAGREFPDSTGEFFAVEVPATAQDVMVTITGEGTWKLGGDFDE